MVSFLTICSTTACLMNTFGMLFTLKTIIHSLEAVAAVRTDRAVAVAQWVEVDEVKV